jgi:hypothetical protein
MGNLDRVPRLPASDLRMEERQPHCRSTLATPTSEQHDSRRLMKHLAYVEDDWFGRWLHDEPRREPWASVDWAAEPDWEWESARADAPAEARTLWQESVAHARAAAEKAFEAGGLGCKTRRTWPDGRSPSLRRVITHMIEEYARHNGHADLLHESVDGQVGE